MEVETQGEASSSEPKVEDKAASSKSPKGKSSSGPLFTLKKWNAVAMWQWDVECDTCAICRVQVMGKSAHGIMWRTGVRTYMYLHTCTSCGVHVYRVVHVVYMYIHTCT